MEITRSKMGTAVSQCKYVLNLLNEIGMLGCKPVDTPMNYTTKLGTNKGNALVDRERYQRLMGKLIYLSHRRLAKTFRFSTLPTSRISLLSKLIFNPEKPH